MAGAILLLSFLIALRQDSLPFLSPFIFASWPLHISFNFNRMILNSNAHLLGGEMMVFISKSSLEDGLCPGEEQKKAETVQVTFDLLLCWRVRSSVCYCVSVTIGYTSNQGQGQVKGFSSSAPWWTHTNTHARDRQRGI